MFNCDEGIDFQSMGRIFTGLGAQLPALCVRGGRRHSVRARRAFALTSQERCLGLLR